jgi:putative membrane protein
MRMRIFIVAAACAAFASFGCNRKDPATTSGSTSGPYYNFNPADRDFVRMVAEANLAETDAGRLALAKSSNDEVKRFAQHMIDDHTKANAELRALADKKGVRLPAVTDDDHQKDAARMAELKGVDFDRAYAAVMLSDHQKAVALFEQHPGKGKDADVRAYAEKTLPTLRKHLTMAEELNGKVLTSN